MAELFRIREFLISRTKRRWSGQRALEACSGGIHRRQTFSPNSRSAGFQTGAFCLTSVLPRVATPEPAGRRRPAVGWLPRRRRGRGERGYHTWCWDAAWTGYRLNPKECRGCGISKPLSLPAAGALNDAPVGLLLPRVTTVVAALPLKVANFFDKLSQAGVLGQHRQHSR